MMLSSIIRQFQPALFDRYHQRLLPSHRKALAAMVNCRTVRSPLILTQCDDCHERVFIPHSCGHRSCPHCQHHESQQWLERQLKKEVPSDYFLLTFTLPAQFRELVWSHQRVCFQALLQTSWETLKTFSLNDKQLQGIPGATAVLHTHARDLSFHPHVHVVMPAAAIDRVKRLWRTKSCTKKQPYLFNHKALAKVFQAKFVAELRDNNLTLPLKKSKQWVVNVKSVGQGRKALVYLGRYLYRGVIQEKNIVRCDDGKVTFRYQVSETKQWKEMTLPGEDFLWRLLQHVLPRRFHRARNFGFLHPNSKVLIQVIQSLKGIDPNRVFFWIKPRPRITCPCCGGSMTVIKRQIPPLPSRALLNKLVPT